MTKGKTEALFIGVRLEACMAFCDMMHNFGYRVSIITLKNSLVEKNFSAFKNVKTKIVLPYIKEKASDFLYDYLLKNDVKVLLSAGYPYIIPAKTLSLKVLFINSHPHLLPQHKGFKVISQSYERKVENYGITTHYINEKVDAGAIILQRKIKFMPRKSKELGGLYRILFSFLEPASIIETVSLLKQKGLI